MKNKLLKVKCSAFRSPLDIQDKMCIDNKGLLNKTQAHI